MASILQWFDENPGRYWWVVCGVIAPTLFVLLRPLLRPNWQETRRPDWGWGGVILVVLMAGRWPTWFVTRQFNPDESQLIAGAMTLRSDPVFWRSVDGGTAGPFDFYALWPAGWIHGADDYFAARLTALVLLALGLIFAHQSLAIMFGRMVARVTSYSAAGFEAFTLNDELLHYSTELVPVCLLAAAIFLLVRRFVVNAGWPGNVVGGLVLGAMPLAKLQAAPLAVLVGAGWVVGELWDRNGPAVDRRRKLIALVAGGAAPILAGALLLAATHQWRHAVIPYLLYNAGYVDAANLPIGDLLTRLWINATHPESLLAWWLAGTLVWMLCTLALPRASTRPSRVAAMAAGALCAASLVCILIPRRPFLHYWQLLVIPWMLLVGTCTGAVTLELEKRRPSLRSGVLCAALVFSAGGMFYVRAGRSHPYVGRLAVYQKHPRGTVALELGKYAHPGETLGAWDSTANSYYVEAGLRQATRNAHSLASIVDSPYYDYFRLRYLADLQRSAPPVFVDTMAPNEAATSFAFRNGLLRHEIIFPELADYIRAHYVQVATIQGVRVYVRNDRLAATLR